MNAKTVRLLKKAFGVGKLYKVKKYEYHNLSYQNKGIAKKMIEERIRIK